jgi:hypothetical protein
LGREGEPGWVIRFPGFQCGKNWHRTTPLPLPPTPIRHPPAATWRSRSLQRPKARALAAPRLCLSVAAPSRHSTDRHAPARRPARRRTAHLPRLSSRCARLVPPRPRGSPPTRQHAVLDALEIRFGAVAGAVRERIEAIQDEPRLRALLKSAIQAGAIEKFIRTNLPATWIRA